MANPTNSTTPPSRTSLSHELQWRGLWNQATDADLAKIIDAKPLTAYVGFDPTAASLHIGHLLPLLTLRRFKNHGHHVIALAGGATGLIGDPTGKSDERKLLDEETIADNIEGIKKSIRHVLGTNGATGKANDVLNNFDWFKGIGFIEFLRDVGKHFSVNAMIAKDSVRMRLEDRAQGISFTEFSYMLLQSYDFYHLHKHHHCTLQIGGSDQWGNITAGCELIRRKSVGTEKPAAYGLTLPLIMRSDGTKFGKSEGGAIWLDPGMTTPYEFYQYFVQVPDSDVIQYLKFFTFLNQLEIAELEKLTRERPEQRLAQKRLAEEVLRIVHGDEQVALVQKTAENFFEKPVTALTVAELKTLFAKAPRTVMRENDLRQGITLVDLLIKTGLVTSKSAARREIEGGGIYLNDERMHDPDHRVDTRHALHGQFFIVRKGKKNHHLVEFE